MWGLGGYNKGKFNVEGVKLGSGVSVNGFELNIEVYQRTQCSNDNSV